jgi:hypothetical protein
MRPANLDRFNRILPSAADVATKDDNRKERKELKEP